MSDSDHGPRQPEKPSPTDEAQVEIAALTRGLKFWARVAAFAAVGAVAVSIAQCTEMNKQASLMNSQLNSMDKSGTDAHTLTIATQNFASAMKTQSDNTGHLVESERASAKAAEDAALATKNEAASNMRLVGDQANALASEVTTQKAMLSNSFSPRLEIAPIGITDIVISAGNMQLGFQATLTNTGNRPATDVSVEWEIGKFVTNYSPNMKPYPAQDAVCARADQIGPAYRSDFSPGKSERRNYVASVPLNNISFDKIYLPPDIQRPYLAPVIIGCISYKSGIDGSVHHTRFLYSVYGRPPDHRFSLAGAQDRTIAGSDLGLFISDFEGNRVE